MLARRRQVVAHRRGTRARRSGRRWPHSDRVSSRAHAADPERRAARQIQEVVADVQGAKVARAVVIEESLSR